MQLFRAILLSLFLVTPGLAEVVKTTSTEYYTVDGTTRAEIFKYIKEHSPLKKGGRTFHAFTESQVKYRFHWVRKGGECSVDKVTVNIHITYTYPKLARTPAASDTRQWWDEMTARLVEHELIHGKIALNGAIELDRELRRMKRLKCSGIEQQVKDKANDILGQTRWKQEEYDRITQHGVKQERYMNNLH